ncbi:MAG: Cof-type HAD-IIB family hydrolase [Lachnospiraceae bacterium]|nr:Cof-type HAD-IIB family hydrolase [Lachnospiraceae bacterium]
MKNDRTQKKILYVSDLDGTLLRSNEKTSAYTNEVINELTAKGMLFSYATARSHVTSTKCTAGLKAKIPIITYNGAVILENETFAVIHKTTFTEEEEQEILSELLGSGVYPIVYAYIEGQEKFSYIDSLCSRATKEFVSTRQDVRKRPVDGEQELGQGEVFYFTCIDERKKLEPLYHKLKDKYHCIFQRDIYSGEQWLEIIPKSVSKANAIFYLKQHLDVDYVVAFGDGVNDMEMFALADEAYAVENAAPELKEAATGMIGDNNSDAVAKWLQEHFID